MSEPSTQPNNNIDKDATKTSSPELDAQLKELVITWFALEDKLREVADVTKELRSEKKQIEDSILQIMETNNEDVIETSKGNLVRVKKDAKGALTPELVSQFLVKSLDDAAKAEELMNKMMDTRPSKSTVGIKKQVVKRGPKTLRQ